MTQITTEASNKKTWSNSSKRSLQQQGVVHRVRLVLHGWWHGLGRRPGIQSDAIQHAAWHCPQRGTYHFPKRHETDPSATPPSPATYCRASQAWRSRLSWRSFSTRIWAASRSWRWCRRTGISRSGCSDTVGMILHSNNNNAGGDVIRWGLFWLSYLLCVINRVRIRCLKLDICFSLFVCVCVTVWGCFFGCRVQMDGMLGIVWCIWTFGHNP